MKNRGVLLVLMFLLSPKLKAQTVENGIVTVCEFVIDSLSAGKPELKTKTKNWFGETFRSAESVITNETEDQINGSFTIKTTRFLVTQTDRMYITVKFKDGKVKISIKGDEVTTSNENHWWPFLRMYYRDNGEIRSSSEEQFIHIRNECISMCRNLRTYLIRSADSDDW